ncbi:Ku protein [Streptomyces mirabilis]|uniref:Ku protein n=1 Tax=Streptomyces mirabilis TaxID=68239 RepID=UPI00367892E3
MRLRRSAGVVAGEGVVPCSAARYFAALRRTKVAVAKLAWHGRERLVLLRVRDGALVAHVLKWDDEVRDPSELAPKDIAVTDSEVDEHRFPGPSGTRPGSRRCRPSS